MAVIVKGENPRKPWTVKWRDADRKQRERSFLTRREAQDFKTAGRHAPRTGRPSLCQPRRALADGSGGGHHGAGRPAHREQPPARMG
jgi:hypothetical protein